MRVIGAECLRKRGYAHKLSILHGRPAIRALCNDKCERLLLGVGYNTANMQSLTTLELCAGVGGQQNRPEWNVVEKDLNFLTDASGFKGVDIVSGGHPYPPFSAAGSQLGEGDDRNFFALAISIIDKIRPRAVALHLVKCLTSSKQLSIVE